MPQNYSSPSFTPITSVIDKKTAYWKILHDDAVTMWNKTASDQAFGHVNCRNDHVLRLFKQLEFYLSIIAEERHWDALNDYYGEDKGNRWYIAENCIKTIRKALICKGFPKDVIYKLFDVFGLYGLGTCTGTSDLDGIGYMKIGTTFIVR